MKKFNGWKALAIISVFLCVGCATAKPNSTTAGSNDANISGTGDATNGAGTGSGGTQTESSGTGNATSGAGTGSGGTSK